MATTRIQSKVIIGEGVGEFFLEPIFNPTNPVLYIENVNESIEVPIFNLVGNMVVFNARIFKNIVYKTLTAGPTQDPTTRVITTEGALAHITEIIPFGNQIKITLEPGEEIEDGDFVEVIDAEIIGSKDYLLDPTPTPVGTTNPPIYLYDRIQEKMSIRVRVKVVRWEHLDIVTA